MRRSITVVIVTMAGTTIASSDLQARRRPDSEADLRRDAATMNGPSMVGPWSLLSAAGRALVGATTSIKAAATYTYESYFVPKGSEWPDARRRAGFGRPIVESSLRPSEHKAGMAYCAHVAQAATAANNRANIRASHKDNDALMKLFDEIDALVMKAFGDDALSAASTAAGSSTSRAPPAPADPKE